MSERSLGDTAVRPQSAGVRITVVDDHTLCLAMDRPCNSQNVRITDCFIRSDDDCVVLKGLDLDGPNDNVENIVVENSVLWCDPARAFLLGRQSRAAYMRSITLRDLDVIHFTMTPFLLEPGEDMRLEGSPGEYLVQTKAPTRRTTCGTRDSRTSRSWSRP